MHPTSSIIAAFTGTAFTVAEALRLGFTRRQIDHASLMRPHRGLRATGAPPQNLRERAITYAPLLRPGELFSHVTALVLYGCPIRVSPTTRIDVEITATSAQVRRPGVCGHRRKRKVETLASAASIGQWMHQLAASHPPGVPAERIVPPLRALVQSSRLLSATELLVALDHMLCARGPVGREVPLVGREELLRLLAREKFPGIRRLRAAAELAREGSASRMETLTRLAAVHVGMPELVVQHTVCDAVGEFIGRFDLADVERRCLIEYDGEQHRTDRRQYLRDVERLDRARDAGWRVCRLHKEDFAAGLLAVGQRLLAFTGRERAASRSPAILSLVG